MNSTTAYQRNLKPETAAALTFSDAERIAQIWDLKNTWIPYTRAKELIANAQEILDRPPADRMPCLLIWADPNSGKTALKKHYCERHPINPNLGGEATRAPVIGIEISSPGQGALYDSILAAVGAPFRIPDRLDKKRYQVMTLLPRLGTRQLVIDELNTAIAGPLIRQRQFLVALKNLANELNLSIIATGTEEARVALAPDRQLASRFMMEELPRWTDDTEFRSLLESFERRLPLKEVSELQMPGFAKYLLNLSEGYIGEIAEIIMQAAVAAIKSKTEKIDLKVIEGLKWKSPSQRRGEAGGQRTVLASSPAPGKR